MIEILDKKDCCGCGACVQRCPKQCISIEEDQEGFLYPQVDRVVCIDCGLCEQVCPVWNQGSPCRPVKVYAAINKDEDIRRNSSSGGVFTLLAEQIIREGGVVFGARFNDQWEVIHDFTETMDGIETFRGSKYVQSRIGTTYLEVESFLKEQRKVLFSGTPCQIAGLRYFLRKKYEHLLTVEIVCHGVPSPSVWQCYLKEILERPQGVAGKNSVLLSLKEKPMITGISFRDKQSGWKKFGFVVRGFAPFLGANQNTVLLSETLDKNLFMRGFLHNLYLRPSCYDCPSKSLKSGSDLTIADYWGIGTVKPELDDDRGVNLILVNTIKGRQLLTQTTVQLYETTYEDAYKGNTAIEKSVLKPVQRELFFKQMNAGHPLVKLINRHTRPAFGQYLGWLIVQLMKRLGILAPVKKMKQKLGL